MTSTSFALPAPLLAWLDAEAARRDMSRNATVVLLLTQAQEAGNLDWRRRTDARLVALEGRLNETVAGLSQLSI